MNWLHIVRVRCEPLVQNDLFVKSRQPTLVITDAIKARPTAHVGRGSEWHIGTTEMIEGDGVSFQMGRVQAVTASQFDEVEHSFFEAQEERAPYTWAVYDQRNQCCGILKKSGVSLSATEVSSKLEILLNSTPFPYEAGFVVKVDPINDPQSFIEQIQSSAEVVKFSFTAEFENPFDVEELIQRPAERFNQAIGGAKTKVEVEGKDLNKEILEDLARAVASTGDDASASIREDRTGGRKRIHLRGTPLTEPVDTEATPSPLKAMLAATREAYDRIRNSIR